MLRENSMVFNSHCPLSCQRSPAAAPPPSHLCQGLSMFFFSWLHSPSSHSLFTSDTPTLNHLCSSSSCAEASQAIGEIISILFSALSCPQSTQEY